MQVQLNELSRFKAHHEISAQPMTLGQYNKLKGWDIPANEDPDEQGYLIVLVDKKPEALELTDLTWCRKSIFDAKYSPSNTFEERLNVEYVDLLGRSVGLSTFIESGKIDALKTEHSAPLRVQSELMATYLVLLAHRITELSPNSKEGRSNYATFNRPAIVTTLSWPIAQLFLERGYTVTRKAWNDKNQFVAYNPGQKALPAESYWVPANREAAEANGGTMDVAPHFTIKTSDDIVRPGWIPSAADLLAKDWVVLAL